MVSLAGNTLVNCAMYISNADNKDTEVSGSHFDNSHLTPGEWIAAIDFEGQDKNLVEISALAAKVTATKILCNLGQTQAWILYPTPENPSQEAFTAKFCHGITSFDFNQPTSWQKAESGTTETLVQHSL